MSLFPADPEPLAALSLWNPWAQLMALGVKTYETRPPWATRLRSLVGCDLAICSTAHREWDGDLGRAAAKATALVPRDLWLVMRDRLGIENPLNWTVTQPRGSVLAVVRVAAVLPMVSTPGHASFGPCVVVHDDGADLWSPSEEEGADEHAGLITELEEYPFGDYAVGRVAIATDNLRPLEQPVPCSGRQQVWPLPALVADAVREQVGA